MEIPDIHQVVLSTLSKNSIKIQYIILDLREVSSEKSRYAEKNSNEFITSASTHPAMLLQEQCLVPDKFVTLKKIMKKKSY